MLDTHNYDKSADKHHPRTWHYFNYKGKISIRIIRLFFFFFWASQNAEQISCVTGSWLWLGRITACMGMVSQQQLCCPNNWQPLSVLFIKNYNHLPVVQSCRDSKVKVSPSCHNFFSSSSSSGEIKVEYPSEINKYGDFVAAANKNTCRSCQHVHLMHKVFI